MIMITEPPKCNPVNLAHSKLYYLDCTCSWLVGYNVHPEYPEKWAEKLISKDPDCKYDHEGSQNG